MPSPASTSSTPLGASSSSSARTSSACSRRTRSASLIIAAGLSAERALELSEHALLRTEVVVGQRVGQLLEQLALLALEVLRDDNVDDDAQIAGAPPAQRWHSRSAHDEHLVRLGPGRDLEVDRTVDCRDLDRRAER